MHGVRPGDLRNMLDASKDVPSPCVNNCCLDAQGICLGCYRSVDEITAWGRAGADLKLEILARARSRKRDVENLEKGLTTRV